MYAIETKNLSFSYKKKPLLKGLDLLIPTGSIYGYLARNGAGKSTTIKLMLGLLPSPKGTIFHNGLELCQHKREILNHVGSLIESPAYYGNLTGYENLLYLKSIYGCSRQNILDILQKVNLLSDKDKKAKSYSTGMKQRLGIGMALLNNPDILILDEPLNGLDPEGVFEMRELITELKNDGKTILLSSHILSEVQKTCTHVGILQDGQLRYQGLLSDLLNNVPLEVNIQSNHTYAIEQICQEDGIEVISVVGDRISITINKSDHDGFMGRLAAQGISELRSESVAKNLEEVYLNLIKQR